MGISGSSPLRVPEPEPVFIDEYDTVSGKWRRVLLEDDEDDFDFEQYTSRPHVSPVVSGRDSGKEGRSQPRRRTERDANGIRCEEDEKAWLGYVRGAWIAHELTLCFDGEELPRWCGWCVASAAAGAALSGDKMLWSGTTVLRVFVALRKVYLSPGLPAPRVWLLYHELSTLIRHLMLRQPWGVVTDEGARSAVIMYSMFFFWRLNSSFFDSNVSCASISAAHWIVQLGIPGALSSLRLAPILGLIVSGAIPLALVLKPELGVRFAIIIHFAGCAVSPATALDPALTARWLTCFAPNALATDFWNIKPNSISFETSAKLGITMAVIAMALGIGQPRAALFALVAAPMMLTTSGRRRPLFLLPPSNSNTIQEEELEDNRAFFEQNEKRGDDDTSLNDKQNDEHDAESDEKITPKQKAHFTMHQGSYSSLHKKLVRNANLSFFFGLFLIVSAMLIDPAFAPGTNLGRHNHIFSISGPSRTAAVLKIDKGDLKLPLTPMYLPPAVDAVLRALDKGGRVWRRHNSPYHEYTPTVAVNDLRSFLDEVRLPATLSVRAPDYAKISFQRKPSHNVRPYHNALLATCYPTTADVCRLAFEPPATYWSTSMLPVLHQPSFFSLDTTRNAASTSSASSSRRRAALSPPVQCIA